MLPGDKVVLKGEGAGRVRGALRVYGRTACKCGEVCLTQFLRASRDSTQVEWAEHNISVGSRLRPTAEADPVPVGRKICLYFTLSIPCPVL